MNEALRKINLLIAEYDKMEKQALEKGNTQMVFMYVNQKIGLNEAANIMLEEHNNEIKLKQS